MVSGIPETQLKIDTILIHEPRKGKIRKIKELRFKTSIIYIDPMKQICKYKRNTNVWG